MVSSTKPKKPAGEKKAPAAKRKRNVQESDDEVEGKNSKYFDSDALDDDSDDGEVVSRAKRTKAKAKATPRKKRKTELEEDEYDDGKPSGNDSEESEANAPASKTKKVQRRKSKANYDSDALDEDTDNEEDTKPSKAKSRKTTAKAPAKANGKTSSPRKKKVAKESDDEEYDDDGLKEGQEVVGAVIHAPTTGRVPPGQISQNSLDFLNHLKDPNCNDRDWFRLHEPVYRVAEKEWKDFIESFTEVLNEVDPQIPHLPPKDVIHRIYRDVRFSNDKTPYKRNFSATFSRSGRKGIFATYHISISPGHQSFFGAGIWCPARNELNNIRTNLLRDSRPFRRVLSAPKFVELFGKAEPHPKGERQNIFGWEDQLKVAPKGVPKDHKDIDILKCRTMGIGHRFSDKEVLDPDFKSKLGEMAKVMKPFVYILNDLMTVGGGTQAPTDSDEDESDES